MFRIWGYLMAIGLVLAAAISGGTVHGQGRVDSVQLNLDGSLTIVGSNFGVGDLTPLVWDDFEDGTNGSILAASPKVGTWNIVAINKAIYSNTSPHSGSLCCYGERTPALQWTNFRVDMPDGTNFYGTFWFKHHVDSGTGQIKLNQVWGTCMGKCAGQTCGDYNPGVMTGNGGIDWWNTYIQRETPVEGQCKIRGNYTTKPSQDTWHRFEWIGKQSTVNTPDGSLKIVVDGETQFDQQNVVTRTLADQRWNLFIFFSGITNMTGNSYTWLDDAYLNDSWARIEICNNATFLRATHCEIQIPSSWSPSSITATVSQGSFSRGETAYLFVVDAKGKVNSEGFPITIGSSNALSPPKGLRIVSP